MCQTITDEVSTIELICKENQTSPDVIAKFEAPQVEAQPEVFANPEGDTAQEIIQKLRQILQNRITFNEIAEKKDVKPYISAEQPEMVLESISEDDLEFGDKS